MSAGELVGERSWTWKVGLPIKRFHAPVEMFWRGLGYELAWTQNTLTAHRDFDGQRRDSLIEFRDGAEGVVEIHCRVRFDGRPTTQRPGEIYDPAELAQRMGESLSHGFGAPVREA